MEASAQRFEEEPHEWRLRSITVAAKMWCGAMAFFFAAFAFAYFYLRSLDPNHSWIIGKDVSPSGGLGVAVMASFLLSGIFLWLAAHRPDDEFAMGLAALLLGLVGIALQLVQYSVLGFGPISGGYASVYFGWTATYAFGALWGLYWIETQVATIWRTRRNGASSHLDVSLLRAGLSACSICWTFFVGIGVIMFIVLYLV
jgi:hypothetical protein